MENKYYVYMAKHNGKVVYIGRGKGTRYEHLNSGCSHIYEANRLHHNDGIVFDITFIAENLTMDESVYRERKEIETMIPLWNKQHTCEDKRPSKMASVNRLKKALEEIARKEHDKLVRIKMVKISKQLAEMMFKLSQRNWRRQDIVRAFPEYKSLIRKFEQRGILTGTLFFDMVKIHFDSEGRKTLELSEIGRKLLDSV